VHHYVKKNNLLSIDLQKMKKYVILRYILMKAERKMMQDEKMVMRKKRAERRKKKIRRQRQILLCVVVLLLLALLIFSVNKTQKPPQDNLAAPLQIAYNRTPQNRTKNDIRYIVVHDTANEEKGADAMYHYAFFNSGAQGMSADFFVDDDEILKVNDYYQYYTWHCDDNQSQNEITNANSIGVAICVNRDGNDKKTIENAALLICKLMAELSIDEAHVVRHYDVSGKNCPASMRDRNWKDWGTLLKKVGQAQEQ